MFCGCDETSNLRGGLQAYFRNNSCISRTHRRRWSDLGGLGTFSLLYLVVITISEILVSFVPPCPMYA